MAQTKAHIRASKKYNMDNYDQVSVAFPKGMKAEIKSAAEAEGMSLAEYIRNAVLSRMHSGDDPEA